MATKEKILKAALRLFAKQGIDKTSTAQITKAVGVAEGTLFVHFKTKQGLIDALYLSIKTKAFSSLADAINSKYSVEQNLKQVAKRTIEYFVKNYPEFVFMELVENDPQVSRQTVLKGRKVYEKLSKAFNGWYKQNKLKQTNPRILQGVIWNLIMVIVRSMKAKNEKKVDKSHLNIIWDAIKK